MRDDENQPLDEVESSEDPASMDSKSQESAFEETIDSSRRLSASPNEFSEGDSSRTGFTLGSTQKKKKKPVFVMA